MSLLKKGVSTAHTYLVLDIENSSVASGLVHLSPDAPRLYGDTRVYIPLMKRTSGSAVAEEIKKALRKAIRSTSEVAARFRQHPKTQPLGTIGGIAVFFSAPWGTPNLYEGSPSYVPEMVDAVRHELSASVGDMPFSMHTGAGLAAFGARAFFTPEPCLVCSVTGELSELMRMDGQGVVAHASMPMGSNLLLRTLQSHAGMSETEARSAACLPLDMTHPSSEALIAAAETYGNHFKDVAQELLSPGDVLRIRIIGPAPIAGWIGRSLSDSSALAGLFPEGGEVRSLHHDHLSPHFSVHAPHADVPLMLQALFVDSNYHN